MNCDDPNCNCNQGRFTRGGLRSADYYRRMADQEWEMAGLARADRDLPAADRHTARARAYERGEEPRS
jgi:hypothetical protein